MDELVKKWLTDPTVGKLIAAVVGIVVIHTLVRFLQRSSARYLVSTDARYRVRKFLGLLGYAAAFVLLAVIFSDRLSSLTVAFGVAGAGVAFALQEVIASVAGWVAISFGGFYQLGDRIQLGGIKGDVIDIGVLRTTLMECGEWVEADQYNGRIVRVANSFVFKEPVFNYSQDFPFLWDEIAVPVKHGSDHRLAREILERVAAEVVADFAVHSRSAWKEVVSKYAIEDVVVDPVITLVANDNWLEFTLRYIVDYRKRRLTKDLLFTRILDEFAKAGGRVSLASATFQLVEAPVLDVRLREKI